MIKTREFSSKILLFGEYSVIRESMALAVDYKKFTGRLNFRSSDSNLVTQVDSELMVFAQYMESMEKAGEMDFEFDVTALKFDIAQGLFFDSTIPQGYGVGSSGALIAALYDRYGSHKYADSKNIEKLKNIFAKMESHFHGASSGFDPLVSYFDSPILIKNKNEIKVVNIPEYNKEGNRCIFLLNTGRPRRTEPLVNHFLEKCKNEKFCNQIDNELIPINHRCIEGFLEGNTSEFIEGFDKLSYFQYKKFAPMIPKLYRSLWKQGLKSEEFYLKLCGAGGGGFLLGMTRDFQKTKETLSSYNILPLFSY